MIFQLKINLDDPRFRTPCGKYVNGEVLADSLYELAVKINQNSEIRTGDTYETFIHDIDGSNTVSTGEGVIIGESGRVVPGLPALQLVGDHVEDGTNERCQFNRVGEDEEGF